MRFVFKIKNRNHVFVRTSMKVVICYCREKFPPSATQSRIESLNDRIYFTIFPFFLFLC